MTFWRVLATFVCVWWKWMLFSVLLGLLVAAVSWNQGSEAGAEVLRCYKQIYHDEREYKQAREAMQASRNAAYPTSTGTQSGTRTGTGTTSPGAPTSPTLAASGELETKAALERLLGVTFSKVRPSWLRNMMHMTGRNLEIDCYNEELSVAVEYSGPQHFMYPNSFHKTLAEFAAQVERDAFKRQVCEERGLVFIVVPHTVPRKDIEAFLLHELTQRGVLPRNTKP